MKKLTNNILLLLFMGLWLTSCRDMPQIGDLAGQWQIQKITFPDGTVVESPQRYYCFYRSVAELTAPGNIMIPANMDYSSPDIALTFTRDSAAFLRDWGIIPDTDEDPYKLPFTEHYHINTLTSSHLEMTTSKGVIIKLRKY